MPLAKRPTKDASAEVDFARGPTFARRFARPSVTPSTSLKHALIPTAETLGPPVVPKHSILGAVVFPLPPHYVVELLMLIAFAVRGLGP